MRATRSLVVLILVVSCGGDSPAGPQTVPPPGQPPALEAISYAALGTSGKIAFQRIDRVDASNGGSGFYVIDVASKTFTLVPGTRQGSITDPVIAPQGDPIAFAQLAPELEYSWDVYAIRTGGTDLVRLSKLEGFDRLSSWTPDGSNIIAWTQPPAAGNVQQRPYVYRQPLAVPQRPVTLWTILSSSPAPLGPDGRVSMSADGVFVFGSVNQIMTLTLPATYSVINAPEQNAVFSPTWSPDGRRIAFLEAVRSGSMFVAMRVQLMGPTGGSVTTVTELPIAAFAEDPRDLTLCWLGADRIVFVHPTSTGRSSLYVVRTDGTGLTRITTAASVTDRSVSCSSA